MKPHHRRRSPRGFQRHRGGGRFPIPEVQQAPQPFAALLEAVQQFLARPEVQHIVSPELQRLRTIVDLARQYQDADVMGQTWTPFLLCEPDPRGPHISIYRNSRYQVHVRRYHARESGASFLHLSLKRLDQRPHIFYRELMRIKDVLVGAEEEAVVLLPARSREVDLANQTHCWLIDSPGFRFPFGFFDGRLVSDVSSNGTVQEPWPEGERPADCLPEEVVRKLFQEEMDHGK